METTEFQFAKESWKKPQAQQPTYSMHQILWEGIIYAIWYFATAQCSIPRKRRETTKTQKESEKKMIKPASKLSLNYKEISFFSMKLH